jgi:hypothetical protein
VDVTSTRYAIARRYMIRLRRDDFDDPHELAKYAATCGMNLNEFRKQFEGLIAAEPPPLQLEGMPGGPPSKGVTMSKPAPAPAPAPAPKEGKDKKKG